MINLEPWKDKGRETISGGNICVMNLAFGVSKQTDYNL